MQADVLLRGYGGYTSRWALFLLDAVLPKNVTPPPALVTIWFGANDASLPDHIRSASSAELSFSSFRDMHAAFWDAAQH